VPHTTVEEAFPYARSVHWKHINYITFLCIYKREKGRKMLKNWKQFNGEKFSSLTLNFNASFSYGNGALSTTAFARHIGTIVALSSAERLLLGLPDRTKACVPLGNEKKCWDKTIKMGISITHLIRLRWEGSRRNWLNNETPDRLCCFYHPLLIRRPHWDFYYCYCYYWSLCYCLGVSPSVNFWRHLTAKRLRSIKRDKMIFELVWRLLNF
jgi:hypothetical protein